MANPTIINCPQNTWTKIATNIKSVEFNKIKTDPGLYLCYAVATGGAAPSSRLVGFRIFEESFTDSFSSSSSVDLYVMAVNGSGKINITEQPISGGINGNGLSSITVGTTEPTNPTTGDLWVDTNG